MDTNIGSRNTALTKYAGKLRHCGLDQQAILDALCSHPSRNGLPERECRAIAKSIGSKPPGQSREKPSSFCDAIDELAWHRHRSVAAFLALGAVASEDGREVLFPMRGSQGAITGWRRRKCNNCGFGPDGKKAMCFKGDKNGLIHDVHLVIHETDHLLVTEGEMDAVAAIDAGHACVIATPGSSPGDRVIAALQNLSRAAKDVILVPDGDSAGDDWRMRMGAACKRAGCNVRFIIPRPGLDLDKRLLRAEDPPGELKRLINEAVTFQEEDEGEDGVDEIRALLWTITQDASLDAVRRHRKIAEAVVTWLHERGVFFHHADRRDFASVMFFDSRRKLLLLVQSDAFLAWLSNALTMNRVERAFNFVISAIETEGLSDRSEGILPAMFWASQKGSIYISNGPGHMAKITSSGVEMVDNGTDGVLFPFGATLSPWRLSDPVNPFQASSLFRDMSCSAEHGPLLFQLWAISLTTNQRTKPPMTLAGGVGSGKTRTIRGVFDLYGLHPRISAVTKNGENDFWAALDAGGLTCFDNVDTRIEWLPDALAASATAVQQVKRRLYTDADQVILRPNAWIAVTTANPTFASDAGLADRLLVVRLRRRTGATAETSLTDEIAAIRDSGLTWIAQTLSRALADQEPVPAGLNARHPDFADFAVRIGRAMGRGDEAVAALRAAEADKSLFNLENDQIGAAMLDLLAAENFHGTAAELLGRLQCFDPGLDGRINARSLGRRLQKLWPHLQAAFGAESYQDTHSKVLRYRFTSRSAGSAGFQRSISTKVSHESQIGSLVEKAVQNPANHAT